MRVERLRLRNFKCYADADVAFTAGVTVIHGLNGSGKSSLLEACFFALYGATPLERTLEEVVTIGAEEAEVDLRFSHAGSSFRVHRRVRNTGERAVTAECTLETPEDTIEGARDVRAYVVDLLRMDADAFVNCAYVRQGEVNKLIKAAPSERQAMIDELLQLGRLEEYRVRARDARRGVQAVRDAQRERLDALDEQVADYDERDLHAELNDLRTDLGAVEDDIERLEENREDAAEAKAEAERVLEAHAERREELDEVEETIAELKDAIAATEHERDDFQSTVADRREEREAAVERVADALADADLDADPDSVAAAAIREERAAVAEERDGVQDALGERTATVQKHAGEAEAKRETATDLESRAEEAREEVADLESRAEEAAEKAAEGRERLEEIDADLADTREEFDGAPVEFGAAEAHHESVAADLEDAREREATLQGDLRAARAAVEEAEDLRDAGKCPECGQSVAGSPHVNALDERREQVADLEADLAEVREEKEALEARAERAEELVSAEADAERLEARRADVAELVAGHEATAEAKREEARERRKEAVDLESRAEEAREAAAEAAAAADDARERVGEANARIAALKERLDALDRAIEAVAAREDAASEREAAAERRKNLAELNDERRERLAEARERKADLAEAVDDERVEHAREEKQRAEEYLERVDERLVELRERRDEIRDDISTAESELERLEALRGKRERVAERLEAVAGLLGEAEELEEMYGDLRAELRQRNVEKLERLLNETFELVYGNDSYARLELDGAYELTVYQKDGDRLDPEQLSGGERAVFNLSLRCAVYRLLAEGIDGAAPLPPLILDEPTVFLDSGHVSRLVDLVESMRDLGVEQILVVSHDGELASAADDLVYVEKDATSNRSRVAQGEAAAAAASLD